MDIRIGAHVSTAGGLKNAISSAQKIGASCLQIFSSAPQQWQGSQRSAAEKVAFKKSVAALNINPVFIHGTYLMNFASDNPQTLQKSIDCLIDDLQFADDIGAIGVIFHFGSHKTGWAGKRNKLVKVFQMILAMTPKSTQVIIENAAGTGVKIGSSLEELAAMRDDLSSPRVKFCIDTCHAFAAGYDLRTKDQVDKYMNQVQKILGWEEVVAIHLNDSKVSFAASADRHANIGEGFIGLTGLREFVTHPIVAVKPFILEVPGFSDTGPDIENMQQVKSFFT